MLNHDPSDKPKVNLEVSAGTAFKVTGVVLLMILSLEFVGSIFTIILLFLAALFLAVALNPAVGRISEALRIKRRGLATGVAFALVMAILTSFLAVTIVPLANQVRDFAVSDTSDGGCKVDENGKIDDGSLICRVKRFQNQENPVANLADRYDIDERLSDLADEVSTFVGENTDDIVTVFVKSTTALGSLLAILIMTFLILVEGPAFIKQVRVLLPKERARKWHRLGKEMSRVITGYINGQLIIAVIAGLFAMLFMTIVGVPNALAMAGIVTFFALIPLFGALVGSAIVVILTLLADVPLAIPLALAAYFFIYQQIENVTIQPWIQGQQTNLSTLQVFLAALVGVQVAGVFGVLLAVPLAACLKIVIVDYLKTNKDYIEKKYLAVSKKRGTTK